MLLTPLDYSQVLNGNTEESSRKSIIAKPNIKSASILFAFKLFRYYLKYYYRGGRASFSSDYHAYVHLPEININDTSLL